MNKNSVKTCLKKAKSNYVLLNFSFQKCLLQGSYGSCMEVRLEPLKLWLKELAEKQKDFILKLKLKLCRIHACDGSAGISPVLAVTPFITPVVTLAFQATGAA